MSQGSIGGHQLPRMKTDDWITPREILKAVGPFNLDPCAPLERPWPMAKRHYTKQDNGLLLPWKGRVWCNPPYGRETWRWMKRCAEHKNATALIFARTETNTWIEYVWGGAYAVLFLFDRLYFYDTKGKRASANSGAPSALVAYDVPNSQKLEVCGLRGRLIYL